MATGAGWGSYLVGKPYTPTTTIRHPEHFDYVPTEGDAEMRPDPSAEELARCAAKRKPAAGAEGAGGGGGSDGAGTSRKRGAGGDDAMTD
jgi:hypothetical protein